MSRSLYTYLTFSRRPELGPFLAGECEVWLGQGSTFPYQREVEPSGRLSNQVHFCDPLGLK